MGDGLIAIGVCSSACIGPVAEIAVARQCEKDCLVLLILVMVQDLVRDQEELTRDTCDVLWLAITYLVVGAEYVRVLF
jgi:hypothetical protein